MNLRKTSRVKFPKQWLLPLASACVGVVACGGGLAGVRTECPAGQTTLDGTCVSQPIADYVGCIRAMGATVASNSAKELSAKAGMAGVTAATQADVQDKLEKSYAKVSDANALEIIHDCRAKTTAAAEAAVAAPQGADPASPAPVAANGAPAPASAPAATPAAGGNGAAAFAGNWVCVNKWSFTNAAWGAWQVDGTNPYTVVDNGDGTITVVNPNDKINPACPLRPWTVRGSTAKQSLSGAPCFGDGQWSRETGGEMSVDDHRLTINVTGEGTLGNNHVPTKFVVAFRCSR